MEGISSRVVMTLDSMPCADVIAQHAVVLVDPVWLSKRSFFLVSSYVVMAFCGYLLCLVSSDLV